MVSASGRVSHGGRHGRFRSGLYCRIRIAPRSTAGSPDATVVSRLLVAGGPPDMTHRRGRSTPDLGEGTYKRTGRQMKKRCAAAALAAAFAIAASAGPVHAGDGGNGGAVGRSPLRLALIQCSNVGGGHGANHELALTDAAGLGKRSVSWECLDKQLGDRYSIRDEGDLVTLAAGDDALADVIPSLRQWLAAYLADTPKNCQRLFMNYYIDFGAGWALPNGTDVWFSSSCLGLPNDTISESGGAGFVYAPEGSAQAAARCAEEWPDYPNPVVNGTDAYGCVR